MPVETSDATSGDNRMPDGDSPFQHELIEELIENYEIASTYEKRNFKLAREDLDIISGKTWSEDDEAQRKLDGRPCLKFPILNQYTDQVIGDWRQNRVDIVVSPAAGHKQNKAYVDEDGNEVPTHEGRAGMIRAIAKSGGADIARDTAFEHAVSCGFGHYRLITEYNGSGFDQDIRYRKINDQFSVHWDPGAEEYDRRDAEWAIVMVSMPKKSFERKYPGMAVHDNLPMEADQYDGLKEWFTEDEVRIAEYFRKEPVKKMMYLLPDGRVLRDDEKNYQSVLDELAAQGLEPVKQREIEDHDVIYMQSTGVEIIDGPRKWPGRFIPIISVWGKEHPEGDGKVTYRSLIRYAHDAQRMFDYMRTSAIERAALEPKVPYTIGKSQIGDYEEYWATANTTNHAYLPYDDEVNPAPPQRTFPPQVAQAYFHESEQARNDVKASIGMYDAAVGGRSNETSGKAIIARQRESDIMSFPFIDNMGRSVQYEYEVVNDLIPHIYDTRRAARMLNSDDTEVRMTLFDTVMDEETGNKVTINDISQDKFDISVSVGPSYTTQRQETAEAMMEFISKVDGAGQLTGDLVAKALDFVGKEDFAKRLRYLLPPEVREAEDMEAAGEEPVPMHIKAQLDQLTEMNTMLEQAVQELQPQLQEKDAQLQKSQASEATAKAQQQMDKQAADIELQRKQVDYDKRLLKLEQRIDDRAAQDKAEREQMAQTVHEQGAAQQSEVLANFTTVAQELVGTIQAQGEAMMAASASIQQGAEQMASSADLIARYFAANRSMDVDEEGRPTKVTVEGFGGVTINGPQAAQEMSREES